MKTFAALLVIAWAAVAPIQGAIIAAAILILSDLITGIVAARKRGEPITSSGLRRTVTKLFVFEMGILAGFVAGQYLLSGSPIFTNMVTGIVALTELKSIFENLNEISGTDLFKTIVTKLGSQNDPGKGTL